MITMQDIYSTIDRNLIIKGYWNVDISGKKKLIDEELKIYLISKIKELNANALLTEKNTKELSVIDLFKILAEMIPEEQYFHTIRHFTHYILNIAGNIQNSCILWRSDPEDGVDIPPQITVGIDGTWEKFETNPPDQDSSACMTSFIYIYDVFINNFMVKEPVKKIESKLDNE